MLGAPDRPVGGPRHAVAGNPPRSKAHEDHAPPSAPGRPSPRGEVEYFAQNGLLEDGKVDRLSPADIVRAMDHFGVSSPALLYRLQNTGLLDETPAEEWRERSFSPVRIARALGITFRARRQFGERLPALAITAWRRGHIGTGRAAELCGLEIEGFRAAMDELGETQEPEEEADLLGAAAGG